MGSLLASACGPVDEVALDKQLIKNELNTPVAIEYRRECGTDCSESFQTLNIEANTIATVAFEPQVRRSWYPHRSSRGAVSYEQPSLEFRGNLAGTICLNKKNYSPSRLQDPSEAEPKYLIRKTEDCEPENRVYPR